LTLGELTIPVLAGGAAHLAMWTAGAWARERIVRRDPSTEDTGTRAFQSIRISQPEHWLVVSDAASL
jgi:hypothetical protein